MTDERIKVEEKRAHGERCAYCHGPLEGALVRCESCGVECHGDCRESLGRCPTLGCGPRRVAERPPASRFDGRAPELPVGARAALFARTLGSFLVCAAPVAASGAVVALELVRGALEKTKTMPGTSPWLALAVTLVPFVLYLVLGWAWSLGRALARLSRLCAAPPVEGTLRVTSRDGLGRPDGMGLVLSPEGGRTGTIALALPALITPEWVLALDELPVRARGVGGREVVVESPAGDLALVFPRR